LGLARFGSKERLQAHPVVKREVVGNRVSYDRGVIEEWYVNGPLGLEQGFTVKQAVGPEVVLDLGFGWSAQAEGRGVRLSHNGKILYPPPTLRETTTLVSPPCQRTAKLRLSGRFSLAAPQA
jgi:hypothetical protein